MKTVFVTCENAAQKNRAEHAAAHMEEIVYGMNGVVLEISTGAEFEFDCGCSNEPEYIVLANFIRGCGAEECEEK